MNRYTGIQCPHCGVRFSESDDIVVCPECGAPYHRACFEQMGGACQFSDRHGAEFTWHSEEEHKNYGEDPLQQRCGRCGTLNSSQNLFCDVCGAPLRRPEGDGQERYADQQQGPFRAMGYNPYTTPYGGVDPDDEIDGVPVKDLAIYVGENTPYYLPRFKAIKTSGHSSINWAAFLLEFIFLLYRKMYVAAAVIFVITNAVTVAVFLALTGADVNNLTVEVYGMYSMISYAIAFAVRAVIGFTFNKLYLNHCLKKIRRLRESGEGNLYYEALTKAGSVSRKAVIIAFCVYMAISMILTYAVGLMTPILT